MEIPVGNISHQDRMYLQSGQATVYNCISFDLKEERIKNKTFFRDHA